MTRWEAYEILSAYVRSVSRSLEEAIAGFLNSIDYRELSSDDLLAQFKAYLRNG